MVIPECLCFHHKVFIYKNPNEQFTIAWFFFHTDTLSVLMYPRIKDNSMDGFHNWNLTSVHYWGEKPIGLWRLYIQNSVILFLK